VVPDDGGTDEDNEKERRITIRKRKKQAKKKNWRKALFLILLSFAWNLASWASVYMRKKCVAHALISSPPLT
jgi:hypothetical protein